MTFTWLNEPPRWSEENGRLHVRTGDQTDFWNRTFYGFIHGNGHFRHCNVEGDFSAEVTVTANYDQLYDQAGLMLMVNSESWLKCGIEFTDGAIHFSTVVTRSGYSDWSQLRVPEQARHGLCIRLTRHGEALRVQFKLTNETWSMARLAMLDMDESVRVGIMCCSPSRSGLDVTFEGFSVGAPLDRTLHN